MPSKTRLLILSSLITLFALTAIQGYLIYNTYQLKRKDYLSNVKEQIKKTYLSPEIDSLLWEYRADFLKDLALYENKKINKVEVLEDLKHNVGIINKKFLRIYNKQINEAHQNYSVKIKVSATDISYVIGSEKPKVLLSSQVDKPIFLLGKNFEDSSEMSINNSTWQIGHKFLRFNKSTVLTIDFRTNIFMSIENWNSVMIRQLAGLLIISVILYLFVISLMHYSIFNLIKQKRLSDIKTDFINNITHELKTPLATLSIATQTLASKYSQEQPEIAHEAIDTINRQNKRLQNLIDQVLNNSLGYYDIELFYETFEVTPFLEDLISDFSLTINENAKVNVVIKTIGSKISADKFYLSTTIINILNNAVKYGGTILMVEYEFNSKEKNHVFSISDNGIGISNKYQKLIFEKFYRVSEKDTHNYKGLGLGLYYCSQIAKAHNGSLTVKSKENEGSTFIIKIPEI